MAVGAPRPGAALKLSVLVIDDDQDIREFLSVFLGLEGFEVTTLADPSVAVSRIRDEVFHLILLDLMMPKIYGLDLLGQIREVDDDIAVIIMASAPSLESATASLKYAPSGYVAHPLIPAELRDLIARITRQRRFLRRRERDLHAELGRQIRDRRKKCGLTIKQVASQASLSAHLLSQIERAEASASLSQLFRIAALLDVRVSALLAGY